MQPYWWKAVIWPCSLYQTAYDVQVFDSRVGHMAPLSISQEQVSQVCNPIESIQCRLRGPFRVITVEWTGHVLVEV